MEQEGNACPAKPRKRRGFTLLELLVVMGVIAALVAILLPSVGASRNLAKNVACGSNLRSLGQAMHMYASENNGWYPRALPLAPGPLGVVDWQAPWPADVCPICWQAGYPALLAPYLGIKINDPYALLALPAQMPAADIKFFRCAANEIGPTDATLRKCGFPLDFGLYNHASQNRMVDVRSDRDFLLADMTWGLAYVHGGVQGPNPEPELQGWWVTFVHARKRLNVLTPDYGVQLMDKTQFVQQYLTAAPPVDDPL